MSSTDLPVDTKKSEIQLPWIISYQSVEKDELAEIITAIVGPYNVPRLINWYKFASKINNITKGEYESIECIQVYHREKDILIRVIPNQCRHLHIWSKGNFVIKFRFDSEDELIETLEDYDLVLKYFEKKYDDFTHTRYVKDPILDKISVIMKLDP